MVSCIECIEIKTILCSDPAQTSPLHTAEGILTASRYAASDILPEFPVGRSTIKRRYRHVKNFHPDIDSRTVVERNDTHTTTEATLKI